MIHKKKPHSLRIFIGIKVPADLSQKLAEFQSDLAGLPARIIKPADMHLTLVPPWKTPDVARVEGELRRLLASTERFSIEFEILEYGPTLHRPRFLWVAGVPSALLTVLKTKLANAFSDINDPKSFLPHVTLARFSEDERIVFKYHPIEKKISLEMPITSVELFSAPGGGGENYRVLASIPLQ